MQNNITFAFDKAVSRNHLLESKELNQTCLSSKWKSRLGVEWAAARFVSPKQPTRISLVGLPKKLIKEDSRLEKHQFFTLNPVLGANATADAVNTAARMMAVIVDIVGEQLGGRFRLKYMYTDVQS